MVIGIDPRMVMGGEDYSPLQSGCGGGGNNLQKICICFTIIQLFQLAFNTILNILEEIVLDYRYIILVFEFQIQK